MYAKALAQFIAAVLAAGIPALASPTGLGWSEWINFGILVAGAVQVYNAANLPGYAYAKAIAAGLSAVLVLLTSFLTDGVSISEWIQVGCAFLVGLGGVLGVRNSGTTNGVFREGRHAVSYAGGRGYDGGTLR
jgi:hypothetical protein